MSNINIGRDAFVDDREHVVITRDNGTLLTLCVRKLGYLEMMNLTIKANVEGVSVLSLLVAACVEDEDGNQFTAEEVGRLKEATAKPLIEASVKLNRVERTDDEDDAKN